MELKDILDLPKKSVVNKKTPKNQFQKMIEKKDFDILTSDVEAIYIYSILNKATTNIMPLQNDDYNISEIMVLNIELRNKNNVKHIKRIFHNAIPNPVILVLSYEGSLDLSLAIKRLNKHDDMKVIMDEIYSSDFITLEETKNYESKFLELIKITNQPQINLYELYKSIENYIVATKLFGYVENYIADSSSIENVLELIEKYEVIDKEVQGYEKNRKAESNFGRQMEWHVKIKKAEKKLEDVKQKMKELC
ncbi:MAG: DUF4391 domain-containing protein [Terrisporobacter sp.]